MNRRLARRLPSLYPRAWRDRYAAEFTAFLESEPASAEAIVNIVWCACREHVRRGLVDVMTPARRLTLLMYACLLAMTAGVNLYWTIDDSAIVPAMRAHAVVSLLWRLVAGGAAGALLIATAAAIPVVRRMLLAALAGRDYSLMARLIVPFAALAILVAWIS